MSGAQFVTLVAVRTSLVFMQDAWGVPANRFGVVDVGAVYDSDCDIGCVVVGAVAR